MTKREENLRKAIERLLSDVDIYYCDFCGVFTDSKECSENDECLRVVMKVTLADTMIAIEKDLSK